MTWFSFNSLRKRYAVLTILLAILMLVFSWFAQQQVSVVKADIEKNIESRNTLIQRNREIRTAITQSRDLVFKFQIDPKKYESKKIISTTISRAIDHIEKLSSHPWIKENYQSTVSELIFTLNDFEHTSKKLIQVRLSPQLLFPSLKIANLRMQPLYAKFTENINLAIKEIEDDDSNPLDLYAEYQLLIELRFHFSSMISNFRMYMLNQLNAFQDFFRINQLNNIKEKHNVIKEKIKVLHQLHKEDKLSFPTMIALEEFSPAALNWIKGFEEVTKLNKTDEWRTDSVIYQNELEPKLVR